MSKIIDQKIAYEPHPVTPARKAELRKQGYRIVDAQFRPVDAPAPVTPPPAAPLAPPPAAPVEKPPLGLPNKGKA